jgi:hypothetical protein
MHPALGLPYGQVHVKLLVQMPNQRRSIPLRPIQAHLQRAFLQSNLDLFA